VTDPEILSTLARRVDELKEATGIAVAIVSNGGTSILAHGTTSLEARERLTAASIFQTASLTKIFTALLFADAVRRGEVGLGDPLDLYAPCSSPTFEGQPITLLDLATHASSLPLRPRSRVDRSQDNPYEGYTEVDLYADLEAVRLSSPPGSTFQYSNFGYGLLGHALSQRTGRTFPELLRVRILDALDMTDTFVDLDRSVSGRLVQGYDADFNPVQPWTFGELAPAGAMFCTLTGPRK
jgi:serine-type D-Ala-D-Ala carboxypeptidase/endopeptidase